MKNTEQYESLPVEVRQLMEKNPDAINNFKGFGLTVEHLQHLGVEGLKQLILLKDQVNELVTKANVPFKDIIAIDNDKRGMILIHPEKVTNFMKYTQIPFNDLVAVDRNKLLPLFECSNRVDNLVRSAKIPFKDLVSLPIDRMQLALDKSLAVEAIVGSGKISFNDLMRTPETRLKSVLGAGPVHTAVQETRDNTNTMRKR